MTHQWRQQSNMHASLSLWMGSGLIGNRDGVFFQDHCEASQLFSKELVPQRLAEGLVDRHDGRQPAPHDKAMEGGPLVSVDRRLRGGRVERGMTRVIPTLPVACPRETVRETVRETARETVRETVNGARPY